MGGIGRCVSSRQLANQIFFRRACFHQRRDHRQDRFRRIFFIPTVVPFAAGKFSSHQRSEYLPLEIQPLLDRCRRCESEYRFGRLCHRSIALARVHGSALAHFGHDTELTQGLTVGQSLGAGFNGSSDPDTLDNFLCNRLERSDSGVNRSLMPRQSSRCARPHFRPAVGGRRPRYGFGFPGAGLFRMSVRAMDRRPELRYNPLMKKPEEQRSLVGGGDGG